MKSLHRAGSVHVNTAANFVTQVLGPASGLLLVPVFLHFIGLPALGLIGLLGALQATLGIFTRGLGWSLQREVARAYAAGDSVRIKSLVRTFEIGYWLFGLALGGLLALLSGPLSERIGRDGMSQATVRACLLLVATRIAIAFPSSVYQAVLLGLRRHVLVNIANSALLLIGVASQVALIAVTRSVIWLYAADVVNAVVTMAILSRLVRGLPEYAQAGPSRLLSRPEIKTLGALSAGLIWVNGTAMWIKQLDRFVVFGATSLTSLAVYTAGAAGSKLLALAYNPFLTAVFPESCLARRDPAAMPGHLIKNSRMVALLSLGVGVPVAFSARELLRVWTRNEQIASSGASVMVVYVVASIFMALASTQVQTLTAVGTTRAQVIYNGAAAVWLWPVTALLVHRYDIVGAALAWLLYNAAGWIVYTAYSSLAPLRVSLAAYLGALVVPVCMITVLNAGLSAAAHALTATDLGYLALVIPGAIAVLAGAAYTSLGGATAMAALPGIRTKRRPQVPDAPAQRLESVVGDGV